MWDSINMADFENFSEINENFETIKTLLNSIRAQGILNTSDVDKLLSGINSKLEKINTEEDIDLIKIFLSELKQNLDERHSVLISKFGAIESLFSNLLKNSSEMPKSAELKELFDIVATNLSVFSREVVSQKESLTDITLRLDALRSDDSQKKDIIKNIALLKPDLERLNNGFDSIVLSLNDNFKTIIKTITTIDKTEHLDKFADTLAGIEMSSNTVLSALQMLDKKAEQVDESLKTLATKDDLKETAAHLVDISARGQELSASLTTLNDRYLRLDSLADKIDASVNIVAGLKAVLEEADDRSTHSILDKLNILEEELKNISSDKKFDEFKASLEVVLKNIAESSMVLDTNLNSSLAELSKISETIKALNIDVSFQNLINNINKSELEVKTHVDETFNKLSTLNDTGISKVLNQISTNADSLSVKLAQTQTSIANLCEKNFSSVFESVTDLKSVVSQIDENSVSANNAIFSSITDRLTVFENSLRESLDNQEQTVAKSSAQLVEQVENIKNLSGVLDYKMDSSVVEVGNIKREFSSLKTAIENVLALDFVNVVKDLRVDLYASKQEMVNSFDSTTSELSEKLSNDLYGKYELLISKLDSVEDEFKKTQTNSLAGLKGILENISSSIVDVLSYVSETKNGPAVDFDGKLDSISNIIKENNLNYVESVRDVVDVIRVQVETNLKNIEEENANNFDLVKKSISENSEDLKKELKFSYSKLLEIQDSYNELKEMLNLNSVSNTDKFDGIIASANGIKTDFEAKLNVLKTALLDKVSEFKQDFTCENADKVSELKFAVENLYSKNASEAAALIEDLKNLISKLSTEDINSRTAALAKILDNFVSLKDLMKSLNDKAADELSNKVDLILSDFSAVKSILEKVDENVDGDMTRQLSIIESNFESLVSQMTILFDKSDCALTNKINEEFNNVSERMQETISEKLEAYKLVIEETFDNLQQKAEFQSTYLQERISGLNSAMKSVWEEQSEDNAKQIEEIAERLKSVLDENIKLTAVDYVALKNKLNEFAKNIEANNEGLTQNLKAQLDDITKYIDSVLELQAQEVSVKHDELTSKLEEFGASLDAKADYINNSINVHSVENSEKLSLISELGNENKTLLCELKASLTSVVNSELTKFIVASKDVSTELNSSINEKLDDVKTDFVSLSQAADTNRNLISELGDAIEVKSDEFKSMVADLSASELKILDTHINNLLEQIEAEKENVQSCKTLIIEFLQKELKLLSKNIEKETDVIISELVEQFDLLKASQADEVVNLTSRMEEVVNAHIYNGIEDLKSYLDIKTDSSVMSNKLDNLKIEMTSSVDSLMSNMNKLLDAGVFTSAMSDFRLTNEILVNSAVDRLNDKIETFINENIKTIGDILTSDNKNIEERLALFDKKFTDTVVDKYEEIKLISNKYNDSFDSIKASLNDVMTDFAGVKSSVNSEIENLMTVVKASAESTNKEIKYLNDCFENLRSQISNKSFDEAFQASINKQIASLESLVSEQMNYIEDINDLCATNLPDLTEMNTIVKHSILGTVEKFSEKLDAMNLEEVIDTELKQFKTDIITQFLNIFNQISFVAEQEEILDFIQDKHDELITILSHIVTTSDMVAEVKDDVAVVDNKLNSVKDDIELINEKITAIISSEGDIDYVYSLQDLESDIANLRIVLNEMKDKDYSQELDALAASTNDIYKLVESIKTDLPTRKDFEGMAEDIVSISTRTNKLILASDESYKTLQDNLHDFKLVINDLDERTRNFSQEAGIDKLDNKLNALNSMMVNGAKTNQVFNQVFEYLAEWVDNASVQINAISNRVETLDDIGQIKVMLADLKAEAEDNSESVELIEALGAVFDKQAKKISSLETKLDKIIVETTINNKNNKLDLSPMEDTLNKFLVAIDEKMSSQQDKIKSLETRLQSVCELLDEKDTAQLTKKVGGMDRQIAKLNKSIEKIASHVVEK